MVIWMFIVVSNYFHKCLNFFPIKSGEQATVDPPCLWVPNSQVHLTIYQRYFFKKCYAIDDMFYVVGHNSCVYTKHVQAFLNYYSLNNTV